MGFDLTIIIILVVLVMIVSAGVVSFGIFYLKRFCKCEEPLLSPDTSYCVKCGKVMKY